MRPRIEELGRAADIPYMDEQPVPIRIRQFIK
jgi:hypothetical protein